MKTILMIGLVLLFASTADARVKLILKDGIILTWSNYFEEKDQYCTHKPFGKFCISKSEVASIQVEDESRGTTSLPTKATLEAKKEQDKPKRLVKEKPDAEKEKVKEREKPIGEKAFRFEVRNPNVRILIPELPPIAMEPHPMAATRPDLRFHGSAEPFIVTIRTPTADPGMTAADCANSLAKSIKAQWGLKDSEVSLRKSSDGNTFAMYYSQRIGEFLFLKAHLFSAYGGKYCIEVHITKVPQSPDEVKKWFEGFPKARIESY